MHRLVCNCRKQEVTSLLFSVSGHESLSSNCFNNQLERDVCLCISTPILVPKVLHKLREDTSVVLLIAPMWPRQSWYPQILDLLIDIPVKLPLWPDLLSQNQNQIFHQNLETLNLVAWKLSNCGTSQKDFLKKLQKLWQLPERLLHTQFMMKDSEYITVGVKTGCQSHYNIYTRISRIFYVPLQC